MNEAADVVSAARLAGRGAVADKAFDAKQQVIEPLTAAGMTVVIPAKSYRRSPRTY
jgi:hypothetical protein